MYYHKGFEILIEINHCIFNLHRQDLEYCFITCIENFNLEFFLFSFRERVPAPKDENNQNNDCEKPAGLNLHSPPGATNSGDADAQNGPSNMTRCLLKSASISGSKCIDVKKSKDPEVFNYPPFLVRKKIIRIYSIVDFGFLVLSSNNVIGNIFLNYVIIFVFRIVHIVNMISLKISPFNLHLTFFSLGMLNIFLVLIIISNFI